MVGQKLANGRDIHQDQGPVEVSLPRRRQEQRDHRLPAHCTSAALCFFKKGQIEPHGDSQALSAAGQFYSLAA